MVSTLKFFFYVALYMTASTLLAVSLVFAAPTLPDRVFATVGGIEISGREYLAILRNDGRRKFYHGQPPEEELAEFRRKVGEQLIDRQLMLRAAAERNIAHDPAWVEKKLQKYLEQLKKNPDWPSKADSLLPQLRDRLREESRVLRLESQIRDIAHPGEVELREFYRQRGELFTTPERYRVSLIMVRVPPWASTDEWESARLKTQALWGQLEEGASFEELARLHSQDTSADQGGDLGFLHRDMLGGGAQAAVEPLQTGQYTKPVRMLEGYALLELTGREPAQLNSFTDVEERAKALWMREKRDSAWEIFRVALRNGIEVRVNERYYELPASQLAQNLDSGDRLAGEQ